MNMPMSARTDVAMDRWNRFLDDLDACASTRMPLENQGKLVRLSGLVLEATGLRLPVGAVCEIHSETTCVGRMNTTSYSSSNHHLFCSRRWTGANARLASAASSFRRP